MDLEYRKQKKVVKAALKKYRTMRKTEDRKEVVEGRKKLKGLYEERVREWRQKKWKKLEECRRIQNFWKELEAFRIGKNRMRTSIKKKDQWLRHFKELLEGREISKTERGNSRRGGEN